jgi:hypothetical protein
MCLFNKQIQPIESVIDSFNPESQVRLRNVPIWTSPFVQTAMAQTVVQVPLSKVMMRVNPKFPTFSLNFQTELYTHEYLHILQAEKKSIDILAFHNDMQTWFNDPASGLPTNKTGGNYVKYYVWYDLYTSKNTNGTPRYKVSDYPIEEFAYIGTQLIYWKRLILVPANIQLYYKGIMP